MEEARERVCVCLFVCGLRGVMVMGMVTMGGG